MILIDYKKKKLLSQDEKNTQDVSFMVAQTELNMQQDVLATKQALSAKKRELENLKCAYPFETAKCIQLLGEIKSLEEGLKTLAEFQKEFGFKTFAE